MEFFIGDFVEVIPAQGILPDWVGFSGIIDSLLIENKKIWGYQLKRGSGETRCRYITSFPKECLKLIYRPSLEELLTDEDPYIRRAAKSRLLTEVL